jgi:hypothetical protein
MTGQDIFYLILEKLQERYKEVGGLPTTNNKSHTIFFSHLLINYRKTEYEIMLGSDEFPIVECLLPNGNYFIMSTFRMMSHFNGNNFELLYSEYWWHDREYFEKALPFREGITKVLRYFSLDKTEFFYEIDAGEPVDAAHNCILYYMRKIYYKDPFIPPTW